MREENAELKERAASLKTRVAALVREGAVVAFSGGVDSSLLLRVACEAARGTNARIYAVMLQTTLHPAGEPAYARRVAKEIGADFQTLVVDDLSQAGIGQNPTDRCYRCKRYLFQELLKEAKRLRIQTVLEGSNADDLHCFRPGLRAIRELGVKSPLADAGLTKAQVRALAKAYGLSVSEKPSTPCLATRFPYGTALKEQELRRVDEAERHIRSLGFYNVRVRVHGEIARIEVDEADLNRFMAQRKTVTQRLKTLGYRYVTLDLEGFRSGSMDEGLGEIARSKEGAKSRDQR